MSEHKIGWTIIFHLIRELSKAKKIQLKPFYRLCLDIDPKDKWAVIVRHPYEIITSGYNYHKEEFWAIRKGSNFWEEFEMRPPEANFSTDVTYQERLNSLPVDEGLEVEMRNVGAMTIRAMYNWPHFDAPNVLTTKFEDLIWGFQSYVFELLSFYGVEKNRHKKIIDRVSRLDFMRLSKEQLNRDKRITNKKREKFVYKRMWKPRHYALAKELFPSDLLDKFGYEI